MFQSKNTGEWRPHPVLAAIPDDDEELAAVLRGIKKSVLDMSEIVEDGLLGKTVVYEHGKSYDEGSDRITGILETFLIMGRRGSFALSYAKYLLCLKRLGEAKQNSRPGQRPSHSASATERVALSASSVPDLE